MSPGTGECRRKGDADTGTPRVTWAVTRRVEALTFDGHHLVT